MSKAETKSEENQPGKRLTAISIDGNSIGLVAGEVAGGGLKVLASKHLELDSLVEVIKRLRHPIFMNVNLSWFPDKELVKSLVSELFDDPIFRNPIVGLLPADKVGTYEVYGEEGEDAAMVRRDALLDSHAPTDPFSYPCTLLFQEFELSPEHWGTRMWISRLAEIIPFLEILGASGLEVIGLVPTARAAQHVVDVINGGDIDHPVTLCDIGKLRTMYSTRLPDKVVMHNPIPVGLARDDAYYFESIKPTIESLKRLKARLGNLLLPPEATPSPIGSRWVSTPQLDCTRFASQISRYAMRAIKANLDSTNGNWDSAGTHFMSGRGSRFPGLDGYMKSRIHGDVRLIQSEVLPSLRLANEVDWEDVRDNLLCVGALCEAGCPEQRLSATINDRFAPLEVSGTGHRSFSDLEAGVVYVLEQRP